jgi:diguanylate cyclase (GGDEF)-like protein
MCSMSATLARTRALLDLALELAVVGPSDEIALRLADAVRLVVDCDFVSVQIWDPVSNALVERGRGGRAGLPAGDGDDAITSALEADGLLSDLLVGALTEPIFMHGDTAPPALGERMRASGVQAGVAIPLTASDGLVGLLGIAAFERPERLHPSADLIARLAGVAAQATVALQNGRFFDAFTQYALHDSLTGLANRLQFNEILRETVDRAAATGGAVALLFIDLDGFKEVNDGYGHDIGDRLLVAVGERLCSYTRARDTVGRLGGDEFAVLIENPAGLAQLSERLSKAFCAPFEVAGRDLSVGASIGVARFPDEAGSAAELLQAADAAMYAIKVSKGPGRVRP